MPCINTANSKNKPLRKTKNTNTDKPTIWLVYAKRQHCRHEEAIRTLGYINWTKKRVRFHIGDIVYLFFNTDAQGWVVKRSGSVKFKAKVVADNFPRQKGDARFWEPGTKKETLEERTFVLEIEEEYTGKELLEMHLEDHGFSRRGLQHPVFRKHELINYIATTFAQSFRPFQKRKN